MKCDSSMLMYRLHAKGCDTSYYYFICGVNRHRNDISVKHICQLLREGDTLLDAGTGLGIIPTTVAMNFDNVKIKAIDIAELIFARRAMLFLPEFKERLYFQMANIMSIKDTFDIVSCTEVLEHIFDDWIVLEKLLSLAKRAIFFSVPSEYAVESKGHLRKYTRDSIAKLIKPFTNNFEIFDYEQAEQCHFVVIRK